MLICMDQTVRCQIPEDCDVLHIHHYANLKSLTNYKLPKWEILVKTYNLRWKYTLLFGNE